MYSIVENPAPAPHLAHLEGCDVLRIVLVTVPRVSRSCEHFPDGFDLHLPHISFFLLSSCYRRSRRKVQDRLD